MMSMQAALEMASARDAAKAIAELNGTQFHGRKLDVNEARRGPERTDGGPEKPRTPQKRRTLVTERLLSKEQQFLRRHSVAPYQPCFSSPCCGERPARD